MINKTKQDKNPRVHDETKGHNIFIYNFIKTEIAIILLLQNTQETSFKI